jgi:hypothetical protein
MPGKTSGLQWSDGESGCNDYKTGDQWCNKYGADDYHGEGSANDRCCTCGGGKQGVDLPLPTGFAEGIPSTSTAGQTEQQTGVAAGASATSSSVDQTGEQTGVAAGASAIASGVDQSGNGTGVAAGASAIASSVDQSGNETGVAAGGSATASSVDKSGNETGVAAGASATASSVDKSGNGTGVAAGASATASTATQDDKAGASQDTQSWPRPHQPDSGAALLGNELPIPQNNAHSNEQPKTQISTPPASTTHISTPDSRNGADLSDNEEPPALGLSGGEPCQEGKQCKGYQGSGKTVCKESGLSICELNECDAGYLLDTVSIPKQCIGLPENNCRGKSDQELEEMLQSLCEGGRGTCHSDSGTIACEAIIVVPTTTKDADVAVKPIIKKAVAEHRGSGWNVVGLLLLGAAVAGVCYAKKIIPAPILQYLGMSGGAGQAEYEMVPIDNQADYVQSQAGHPSTWPAEEEEDWGDNDWGNDGNDGWDSWDNDDGWGSGKPNSKNRVVPSTDSEKRQNDKFNSNR